MVRILSQLRESDLPVGDANRMLCSSSGQLELLPIYRPSVDYIGSKGTREYAILVAYVNVGHTTENCIAAVSIVNGNVWVNMWATAYALPMWRRTHGSCS